MGVQHSDNLATFDSTTDTSAAHEPHWMTTEFKSLDALFEPRNVALIGASERRGSVGRTVMCNLLANPFGGCVFPINQKRKSVLGVAACPTVSALPEPVDLAVIVTPAETVPEVIEECGESGIPAAIVISAGFKELGQKGIELENRILRTARTTGMRIVGPNCVGVINPLTGLNATFAGAMARPGNVAFLSQSGALCTSILDWSLQEHVGFSAFVSLGSMIDVDWGDLIEYFGRDPRTRSILLYIESVGNARSFLSAAREAALSKPIIAIKAGRTTEAAQAAASHTGSLAGSDMAFDAALQRVGVLRVDHIAELFSMAEVFGKQPQAAGKRLTIITNAGGPGVLATDELVKGGGQLAELAPDTQAKLNEVLPEHWSHANPIDILGDANPERYAKTLEIAASDPGSDGLLVVLSPQDMTDSAQTAERLCRLASGIKNKPVLASWMGGPAVAEGIRLLNQNSIPTFAYPDMAARAFNYLWRHTDNLRNIYQTPALVSDTLEKLPERQATARAIIDEVRATQRTLLTEDESKSLLAAYGIPVVSTRVATTVEEAASVAEQLGFPVVLKVFSHTVTHKTDVQGVRLDLQTQQDVAEAYRSIQESVGRLAGPEHFQGVTIQPMIRNNGYELILGSVVDPQFGPVLMFGTGGQLVEVFRDRSVGLPPLNATLARRMMEQTKIYTALKGTRGRPPVDLRRLEQVLINFGTLMVEQPWIKECDINPLLASPEGHVALDARIVLHPAEMRSDQLPVPAIRPYPAEYSKQTCLKDGTAVTLRPIRLEDEPLMVQFHESLSELTVRRRYFQLMR